ncbi:glycosyltransferase involved in cell wall biosynthesis [Actinopolyspora biskrensis]|uniref:Glycosyltransferase involved in cell wall biosynthesis n=1 Tax=Actinopolyspora biskrensis TaxID=1470178 RepID=A0A852Z149_9ACTN|nr:galactosyltransferase-related protein [Actinopolyspora biskrensis]NYH79920.1 glycosyltransferase involved in cell wall biosynthesis [Actinopolyspora biskrensis]
MYDEVAIVVPWRRSAPERSDNLCRVVDHFARTLPGCPLYLSDDPGYAVFNRSASRNRGVRAAHAHGFATAVVCDADILIEPEALYAALACCQQEHRLQLPYTRCLLCDSSGRTLYEYPDSVGGAWVIPCAAYLRVWGCDPHFLGWGYEDTAFWRVCDTLLGTRRHEGSVRHLWHPPCATQQPGRPEMERALRRGQRYADAHGDPEAIRCVRSTAEP